MIKRVYQNQAQVWEDMHKDQILEMMCSCSPDQAPRRLYTVMTRLEEDAEKVRESVRNTHCLQYTAKITHFSTGRDSSTVDSRLGKYRERTESL